MSYQSQGAAETYVVTNETDETVSEVITNIDLIQAYIQEQIEQFLSQTGYSVKELLQVEETAKTEDELFSLLIKDLAKLLRLRLLSSVSLMIIDRNVLPTGDYRVIFRSYYKVDPTGIPTDEPILAPSGETGGKLHITREQARYNKPVLILEWKIDLDESDLQICSGDDFEFNWQPPIIRTNERDLIRSSRGMLTEQGKVLVAKYIHIIRN